MPRARTQLSAMRVASTAVTAEAGLHQVMADLVKLGWGPVDNRQHDLGTDLLVHVRDHRGFDRALLIGAQVKAGESYFRLPTTSPDPDGWWYTESGTDHFDLWSNHVLPHLLILHDVESLTSYWVRVTPDRVVSTGAGAKILVPSSNTLDMGQLPAMLDELSQAIGGEHDNYRAVAPGDRLRHAILAPFDHATRRAGTTSSPPEFISAVMRGLEWKVRGIWVAPSRRTWAVEFAEAVAEWRLTGEGTALRNSARSARLLKDKCAATILYTASLQCRWHSVARTQGSISLGASGRGECPNSDPYSRCWFEIRRVRLPKLRPMPSGG